MTAQLNPYLTFAGDAREAMEFYRRVFGGDLTLTTFGEFGTQDPAYADQIMHGLLRTAAGHVLMASDLPPGEELRRGNDHTVCLSGDDADELRSWWEQLCVGGTVGVPLEKQMWGDEYGQCEDRFGTPWMVNITTPST
ncbi:VOC family protein [Micromonospora endolithica]|uniref:VOC family protein n=1 Tax=Micromonospora endolithica TaxID=230091 RepID=A0A3A9YU99_9ACTN|nr:VOC family protein [Micromonospora endolithica]RKN39652.1 VOC family protein [Micromonospora endolithica]TWJ22206.1 PhnB protein [Micromonospora endolithica]